MANGRSLLYSGKRQQHKKQPARSVSLVYDPSKEELSKEELDTDRDEAYSKVLVPGRSNPVEIYLDIGDGKEQTRSLIARVDLKHLGWAEWLHRLRQVTYTQEIWVKGKVPSSHIRERVLSWPLMESKSGCDLPRAPTKTYSKSFTEGVGVGP